MSLTLLLIGAQLAAAVPAPAPQAGDIVVTAPGDKPQKETLVYAGSRLPRAPVLLSPYIASSTGFRGLTPDSGLDAYKSTRFVRTKTCVVTGATLSKAAACGLVPVQKALLANDPATARTHALRLLAVPGLTVTDLFVTQSFLYRIAETAGDAAGRRAALEAMVESGLLAPADELAAAKTLAAMAYSANDRPEALRWYRTARLLDRDDTRTLINLAALLQSTGARDEARGYVREAVAVVQRQGGEPPRDWIDNSR
ncbi:tetratricopeptide repeat protein [Glacieibacterium frigidum]|uniref:Uncharacterized protein n=1 Tax=Glacieibacterium frigidum TaxID=2593303 RepID=A0A552U788_9SPHN|nr:tetratricopeptide repeat protein [Glacieibacterium frigidum]TRW14084.1 hypothetical protein FMM06_10145 [Glacieibacterium frigidum]